MRTLREEILARAVEGEGGCLEWRGAMDHTSPVVIIGNVLHRVRAPVRSVLFADRLRAGLIPASSCGNPRCIAEAHFVQLTRSALMKRRGVLTQLHRHRIAVAKRAKAPKLTQDKAREIRTLCCEGVPRADIAARYGVTKKMVWLIEVGRCWAEASPFGGLAVGAGR